MGKKSNLIKSDQLGILYGTANAKLKKSIMFMLAQKCNMDTCFQCNTKILTVDDFSIEHKQPWLHIDPKLFFDLDNIAFSHLLCNIKTKRGLINPDSNYLYSRSNKGKVERPLNTEWCSRCKKYLLVNNFHKDISKKNGLCSECIECRKEVRKKLEWRNR